MLELQRAVSACKDKYGSSRKRPSTRVHCAALPQALIALAMFTTFGLTLCRRMEAKLSSAKCHWLALSHALLTTLKVKESGGMLCSSIVAKRETASCQAILRASADMLAVKLLALSPARTAMALVTRRSLLKIAQIWLIPATKWSSLQLP